MGKKILLVDDEKDIVAVVEARLAMAGYTIVTAFDGQEALEVARRESPDLILLDLMLPKLDGHKVCRMLKFDKAYEHIPIIMFTAKTAAADKKLAQEVGADAYITKPFDMKALVDTVKKYLG